MIFSFFLIGSAIALECTHLDPTFGTVNPSLQADIDSVGYTYGFDGTIFETAEILCTYLSF